MRVNPSEEKKENAERGDEELFIIHVDLRQKRRKRIPKMAKKAIGREKMAQKGLTTWVSPKMTQASITVKKVI